MFADNTALTWMLVILNTIFFLLACAGMIFATIAARDMATAKAAIKEQQAYFAKRENELQKEIGIAKLRCRLTCDNHKKDEWVNYDHLKKD